MTEQHDLRDDPGGRFATEAEWLPPVDEKYQEAAVRARKMIQTKAPRTDTLAALEEAERLAPVNLKGMWSSALISLREGKEVRSKVEEA